MYGIDPLTETVNDLIPRTERLGDDALLWGRLGWGRDQELLAQTVELLQGVAIGVARLGGAKASDLPKFTPVPRPKRPDERRKTAADKVRDFARMLRARRSG